eukprot:1015702-Rhodomonas_salina.1
MLEQHGRREASASALSLSERLPLHHPYPLAEVPNALAVDPPPRIEMPAPVLVGLILHHHDEPEARDARGVVLPRLRALVTVTVGPTWTCPMITPCRAEWLGDR